jgi:hypothetical protein
MMCTAVSRWARRSQPRCPCQSSMRQARRGRWKWRGVGPGGRGPGRHGQPVVRPAWRPPGAPLAESAVAAWEPGTRTWAPASRPGSGRVGRFKGPCAVQVNLSTYQRAVQHKACSQQAPQNQRAPHTRRHCSGLQGSCIFPSSGLWCFRFQGRTERAVVLGSAIRVAVSELESGCRYRLRLLLLRSPPQTRNGSLPYAIVTVMACSLPSNPTHNFQAPFAISRTPSMPARAKCCEPTSKPVLRLV